MFVRISKVVLKWSMISRDLNDIDYGKQGGN